MHGSCSPFSCFHLLLLCCCCFRLNCHGTFFFRGTVAACSITTAHFVTHKRLINCAAIVPFLLWYQYNYIVCVCVCVRERERERDWLTDWMLWRKAACPWYNYNSHCNFFTLISVQLHFVCVRERERERLTDWLTDWTLLRKAACPWYNYNITESKNKTKFKISY